MFFAIAVASAFGLASGVAADFLQPGTVAHVFSTQNSSLVFAPASATAGAFLHVVRPGDGSASDLSAFTIVRGSGVPTQIAAGGFCVSARDLVPQTANQTLHVTTCNADDPTQLWTLNENPPTISNADGNCISLGRPAIGVPIILDFCDDAVLRHEQWNPKPVSA
ncbi:hypothetical protein C8Q77DRAFT_1056909 [Trametes polyzona]|nr:hypothetical protein C8Q77DRAFT_1056909 [Trametes polyzona]